MRRRRARSGTGGRPRTGSARRRGSRSPARASPGGRRSRSFLFIAVTGTPGTGKSTLAKRLARDGALALEAADLARSARAMGRRDRPRATTEVDVARVDRWWRRHREELASALPRRGPLAHVVVVTGHWSHDLAVDGILVLRASPRSLRRRLASRRYSRAKIDENVEAEALDVILAEAVAAAGRRRIPVAELVTSGRPPAAVARQAERVLKGDWGRHRPGGVDWSDEFLRCGAGAATRAPITGRLRRAPRPRRLAR